MASCSPLVSGASRDPQKRFIGGFSWRHRGHGACCSVMVSLSSFSCPNIFSLTLAYRPIHPRFRPPDRWSDPKVSIANYGMSQPTDTDSFRRNSLPRSGGMNQLKAGVARNYDPRSAIRGPVGLTSMWVQGVSRAPVIPLGPLGPRRSALRPRRRWRRALSHLRLHARD